MLETTRYVMTEPGQPLAAVRAPSPTLETGEVLVEVAGCGVCHTDLGFYYDGVRTRHELPLALGHEVSGFVVEAGGGAEGWVGKAVVVPAVIPCGECADCRDGMGAICTHQIMPGNDCDGGFASHLVVPARGLCEVPGCTDPEAPLGEAGITLRELAVVADAVSTPYQAVKLAEIREGDLAIVVGAGGVGGYAVQLAAAFGARVVALDIDDEKLARAAAAGAVHTLNVRDLDARAIKKAVAAHAKEASLPATRWRILECSGSKAGQEAAFALVNHGAVLMVVGFTREKLELRLSNLMAFHARVQGNWGCLPELYPELLELVLSGKVRVAEHVALEPLTSINEVFEAVHAGERSRRVVLVPQKERE